MYGGGRLGLGRGRGLLHPISRGERRREIAQGNFFPGEFAAASPGVEGDVGLFWRYNRRCAASGFGAEKRWIVSTRRVKLQRVATPYAVGRCVDAGRRRVGR